MTKLLQKSIHKKKKKIRIHLRSAVEVVVADTQEKNDQTTTSDHTTSSTPQQPCLSQLMEDFFNDTTAVVTTPDDYSPATTTTPTDIDFQFFAETHEEQAPEYRDFCLQRQRAEMEQQLRELEVTNQKERQDIDKLIQQMLHKKLQEAQRNLQEYQTKSKLKEEEEQKKLYNLYKQRITQNRSKIHNGLRAIQAQFRQELEKAMQQHRQQQQNSNNSQQQHQEEWTRIAAQINHQQRQQMQQFHQKGEELQKKTNQEFKQEELKLKQIYNQKRQQVLQPTQIQQKIKIHFQHLQQKYIKKQTQRIEKQKLELMQQLQQQQQYSTSHTTTQDSATSTTRSEDATTEVTTTTTTTSTGSTTSSNNNTTNTTQLTAKDMARSAVEDVEALQPPAPFTTPWHTALHHPLSSASARHKHRKGVLLHHNNNSSTSSTTDSSSSQHSLLSIEIHNEGLWVMTGGTTTNLSNTSEKESSPTNNSNHNNSSMDPSTTQEQDFIPWSIRAHRVLQAILCGEIPHGFDRYFSSDNNNNEDPVFIIRCVDLRTSEETAVQQRSRALLEQERELVLDLERKVKDLSRMILEADSSARRNDAEERERSFQAVGAAKELEGAKRVMADFRSKAKSYLGPDDSIIATNIDQKTRDNIIQLLTRYKDNLQKATQKDAQARQAHAEAQAKLLKVQSVGKLAKKKLEIANAALEKRRINLQKLQSGDFSEASEGVDVSQSMSRAKETITILQKVARMRRAESNKKKNGGASSAWVQSIPGIPVALRKSIWSKLHRRKVEIVLRPTQALMLNSFREHMRRKITSSDNNFRSSDAAAALIRGEQQLLRALHPVAEGKVLSAPSHRGNESWSEPGWKLRLEVPQDSDELDLILPQTPFYSLLESNICEIYSAPGNQAASLQRSSHFRSLALPLSTLGTISSLSEENLFASSKTDHVKGDPLYVTEEEMRKGYTFHATTSVLKPIRSKALDSKDKVPQSTSSVSQDSVSSETKRRRSLKVSMDSNSAKRQKQDLGTSPQIEQLRSMQQKPAPAPISQDSHTKSMTQPPNVGTPNNQPRPNPTSPQRVQSQQRSQMMNQPQQGFNPQAMRQMPQFFNPLAHPNGPQFQNQFQQNMNMMHSFQTRGNFPQMQYGNPNPIGPPQMQQAQMSSSQRGQLPGSQPQHGHQMMQGPSGQNPNNPQMPPVMQSHQSLGQPQSLPQYNQMQNQPGMAQGQATSPMNRNPVQPRYFPQSQQPSQYQQSTNSTTPMHSQNPSMMQMSPQQREQFQSMMQQKVQGDSSGSATNTVQPSSQQVQSSNIALSTQQQSTAASPMNQQDGKAPAAAAQPPPRNE